jgi:glycerol-3-phosphate acyltransferase PlsY
LKKKGDIREVGSKNIGATNVLRVVGKKAAATTLVLDMLKGALPVAYGLRYFDSPVILLCGGAAVVTGHLFPIFLKFKGGKGVAALLGVFLVFNFPAAIVFLVSFFAVFAFTKYVSAGSLIGVLALFFYTLFTGIVEISIITFVISMLILIKHSGNIKRLMAGTENRLNWEKNG